MYLAALVLCSLALTHADTSQIVPESKERVKEPQKPSDNRSGNNIAFELPDLTVQEDTEHGEIQLEAFKATHNDRILLEQKLSSISQLYWVSIGHPKLLRTRSKRNASKWTIFHLKTEGFYIKIQMMTREHRKLLSETASRKYQLPINSTQIKHLILSQFECVIELYENDRKYIINGAVRDFRKFPLRMDFRALAKSRERRLFTERLEMARSDNTEDMELICKLASSGRQLVTNTLVISSELSQNLGLADKLFGPVRVVNQTIYVTRNQLTALSAELYSALKVVEAYEIPEYQFKEDFVEELIKQAAVGHFEQVDFNQAIRELSVFGVDFGSDLKADEIQNDIGNILKVVSYKNKSHIIVNEEDLKGLEESGKFIRSSSGFAKYIVFNIGASLSVAERKSKEWRQDKISLNDQLRELNSDKTDDIEWKIEGNKVLAKSINAVKISHAKFVKTLTFKRIRRQFYEAPYQRKFSLYTEETISKENDENLRKEIQRLRVNVEDQRNMTQRLKESVEIQRNETQRLKETSYTASNDISRFFGSIKQNIEEINSTMANHFNECEQLKMNLSKSQFSGRILLDVGGRHFSTTVETLTAEKDTFFTALFSQQVKLEKDENGRIFIDGNGDLFSEILGYMRSPEDFIVPEERLNKRLITEARFYKLKSLLKVLGDTFKGDTLLTLKQRQKLNEFYGKTDQIWALIYKATRDGFEAANFHRLCDNQGPTLVVIISAAGQIFGGYASQSWTSRGDYTNAVNSFLFLLSNANGNPATKLLYNNNGRALYNNFDYGPTFGSNHDLQISDRSNANSNSHCSIGGSYPNTLGLGANTFTGARQFLTTEIEVFKLA